MKDSNNVNVPVQKAVSSLGEPDTRGGSTPYEPLRLTVMNEDEVLSAFQVPKSRVPGGDSGQLD